MAKVPCPACHPYGRKADEPCPYCDRTFWVQEWAAPGIAAAVLRDRDLAKGDAPDPEVVEAIRARRNALDFVGGHGWEVKILARVIAEFERLTRLAEYRREENSHAR